MFLVGGGILLHGLPMGHEWVHAAQHAVEGLSAAGGLLKAIVPTLLDGVAGVLGGLASLAVVALGQRIWRALRA
jgi:predicted DNA repair protein MutK